MANDIDVDALYDSAMNDSTTEIPMGNEPETVVEEPAAPQVTTPELEFTWNGKQIKTKWDDPKVKQWVSQGYDYSQKMDEFKKRTSELEENKKKFEPYMQIDEWATKNPDKWNAFKTKWAQEQAAGTPASQSTLPPEIVEKLEKHDLFIQKLEQKEQEAIIQKEDSELEAEIKSVKESYPNLDFDAPTHDGKSLEYKVLEYGTSRGIKSFADAFYAFNHKSLFNLAEEKGKEAVSKDIQKKTKQGLLGKSSTPTKSMARLTDVRNVSYEDILNDIKQEMNLG